MGNPKTPTTEQDKARANGHYAAERNYPAVDIAHYRNWIPIYLMRSRRALLIWGTVGVLSATGILSHVGVTGNARWLLALWSGLTLFSLSRGRRWAHTLYGVLAHNARSRSRVAYILKESPKSIRCFHLMSSYLQGYGSVSTITDRATFEDTGSRLSNLKLSESVDSSALPSEELAAWESSVRQILASADVLVFDMRWPFLRLEWALRIASQHLQPKGVIMVQNSSFKDSAAYSSHEVHNFGHVIELPSHKLDWLNARDRIHESMIRVASGVERVSNEESVVTIATGPTGTLWRRQGTAYTMITGNWPLPRP